MRSLLISAIAAVYLYGASEPQGILGDVAKLRQKYEECRQGQSAVGAEPKDVKGYQSRIANLETQVKEDKDALTRLQKQNSDLSHELSQKSGIVKNMEHTLTARDKQYREAVAQNEQLSQNINTVKVSKIERESLKKALVSAKEENDRLTRELNKAYAAHPAADTSAKLQATQVELTKAQATITRLQSTPAQAMMQEKVVYKDRPVIQEKIVTKVVEPTEKIKALQNELSSAQTTIANLKNGSSAKVVYKDRIVTKVVEPTEKIKALQSELSSAQTTIANLKGNSGAKVVYKDRIVTQEKVVYKDRPVVQEKIVTKVVEPTEKIKALQTELAAAQTTIANLKNAPAKVVVKEKIVPQEKVVFKDRIVTQEKVVYQDRPVEKVVYKDRPVIQEKIVTKIVEPTDKIKALQSDLSIAQATIANLKNTSVKADEAARRQMDKLALERERQKNTALKAVVAPAVSQPKPMAAVAPVAPKVTKIVAKSVAVPPAPQPKPVAVAPVMPVAPKVTKIAAKSVVVPPVIKKAAAPTETKPVAVATAKKVPAQVETKSVAAAAITKKVSVPTETKPAEAAASHTKVGASAYRMATNAPVYTAPGGAQVDTWEARRSFTSGTANNGWIKITGYFVNRVWQRADEDLWVKESDVIKR